MLSDWAKNLLCRSANVWSDCAHAPFKVTLCPGTHRGRPALRKWLVNVAQQLREGALQRCTISVGALTLDTRAVLFRQTDAPQREKRGHIRTDLPTQSDDEL